MAEKFTWIVFRAHPSQFVTDDDFHPDFFGTFVCPTSRLEPGELLKELLGNRGLALIDIKDERLRSDGEDWGVNERLKRQVAEGYGLSLVKVLPPPIEVD